MRIASGRVIDGRVELDESTFPEGAEVTVLLQEDDETFDVDEETKRMLLHSMAEGDRGNTVLFDDVIAALRRRE